MKKDRRLSLRLAVLSAATAIALISTTAGALAWYAYSRSVTFSFMGTSVAKSALLSVGLVDDSEYLTEAELNEFGLVREIHDDHKIDFTSSKNGLSVDAIRRYLYKSPYAIDKLFPLTTQERALNDETSIELYKNPEYGETSLTVRADPGEYVVLPFAFKILDEDSETIPDKKVWLTEAVCQAEEGIHDALRIYVEGTDRNFLMRPADASTSSGYTNVGGVLDLDGDGTYDYNKSTFDEYVYGQFDATVPHDTSAYGIPKDVADLANVNGVTGDTTTPSTFLAKHNEYAKVANFELDENESGAHPLRAEFETFGTVKPSVTENGEYYVGATGIPLASTTSASKIGYTTLTIFIEGWDHSVVDKAAGYQFNLGLRFEIDRL